MRRLWRALRTLNHDLAYGYFPWLGDYVRVHVHDACPLSFCPHRRSS